MSGPRWSGAVLAGGASRRMGTDKAMVDVGGTPMALRVAAALRGAGAADVIVVGGPARPLGLRSVAVLYPGEGPLAGLLAALGAADTDVVAVAACDLAWLDAATVAALVGALGAADVALARTDRLEPLCGAWRRAACAPALAEAYAAGERAVHRALGALTVVEVDVAPVALTNVNTRGDLTAAGGPDRSDSVPGICQSPRSP